MSKLRKPKSTFLKKDGDSPNLDVEIGLKDDLNSTQENVGQQGTSTSTTCQDEKIVIMYPLEKEEPNSVKTLVNNIEKMKDENLPPESNENLPPADPIATMLMNLQKNIQDSNELHAKEIKSEIGGLKSKIDENNEDMTNKMNGLKSTMDQNAQEFRREITRIDKRLDDHEAKTSNLIDRAIAEAIRNNNAERDALWNRRISNIENSSNQANVETLIERVSARLKSVTCTDRIDRLM